MAHMAHFSFPYYFKKKKKKKKKNPNSEFQIPNSEIPNLYYKFRDFILRISEFGDQNSEFGIVK